MTKFSIIIPIYNTEQYLAECINSVINQSYQNIEIILINDGSPLNADEICNEYANKDSRIKYFSKQNEGVAVARNYGISKATGDYIFFMDSDDSIEKDFIKNIANTTMNNSADLIIIGKFLCRKGTDIIGASPTWGIAVKKAMLDKYSDVRFTEGLQPCEDGLFTHKLLALTNKIAKCPNAIYNYREHEKSSEHTIQTQRIIHDMPIWFDILEKFYNEYNLWDTHKLHLLAFIENEPFSLRFCKMDFSEEERKYIFDLIHSFIKQHSLNKIPEKEFKRYSRYFRKFVKSSSYFEYRLRTLIPITGILETLFSIKNEKKQNIKRKVITILGIKVKFKCR